MKRSRRQNRPTSRVPRSLAVDRKVIIPRIVDYEIGFAADPAIQFGFGISNLWVNGTVDVAIPGASEISALFRYARVARVEITCLPGCNVFGYAANTAGTGTRNIPWSYDCVDLVDTTPPTLSSIRQMAGTRVALFDKMLKRVVNDPQMLFGGGSVLGPGVRDKQYLATSNTTVFYNGWKVLMDLQSVALTWDIGRISFKIFYECHTPV